MRFWVALAMAGLTGCRPSIVAPRATTPSALPNVPVVAARPPIGLRSFVPPPAEAVAKNDQGVGLLAKGNATEAATELEGALALAPDFTLARYNLACALARAGDFERARAALEAVFEQDFVGMRAHAMKDADLAAFWKSPAGAAVSARLPDWDARYAAALARGVRAILWHDGSGQRGLFAPSLVRVGVYDAGTRRFVPVAPPAHRAFFGFAASMTPYAVVAEGGVDDTLGGDMDAGETLDSVAVYPISTAGAPVASIAVGGVRSYTATMNLGSKGLTLFVYQAQGPLGPREDQYGERFDLDFGGPVRKAFENNATVASTRDRPSWMELGYNHWGRLATETDGAWSYAPHALRLPSGATLPIPKARAFYEGPARVVPSPSGDRAVLVWNATVPECRPSETIPGRYKMALVRVATGSVTPLGEGEGAGAAAFDPRGDLYVQRGRRVFQVGDDGETPLPEGVLLVPPVDRADECGF